MYGPTSVPTPSIPGAPSIQTTIKTLSFKGLHQSKAPFVQPPPYKGSMGYYMDPPPYQGLPPNRLQHRGAPSIHTPPQRGFLPTVSTIQEILHADYTIRGAPSIKTLSFKGLPLYSLHHIIVTAEWDTTGIPSIQTPMQWAPSIV